MVAATSVSRRVELPISRCEAVPNLVFKVAQAVAGVFLAMGRAFAAAISWVRIQVTGFDSRIYSQKVEEVVAQFPAEYQEQSRQQLNQLAGWSHGYQPTRGAAQNLNRFFSDLSSFRYPQIVVRLLSRCKTGEQAEKLLGSLGQVRNGCGEGVVLVVEELCKRIENDSRAVERMEEILSVFAEKTNGHIEFFDLTRCRLKLAQPLEMGLKQGFMGYNIASDYRRNGGMNSGRALSYLGVTFPVVTNTNRRGVL